MSVSLLPMVFVGLIKAFGSVPWLERFLNLGVNKKLFSSLIDIVRLVGGNGNVEQALQAIQGNRELELQFQRELVKLENTYWKEVFKDKRNARARDLELQKLKGHNKRANIMFVIAILGVTGALGFLILFKPSLTNSDIIAIISGFAATFGYGLRSIYDFEFGTGAHHQRRRHTRDYDEYDFFDHDDFQGGFTRLNKKKIETKDTVACSKKAK